MTEHKIRELAQRLGNCLKDQNLTLATAESCTGGWIAKIVTDLAGSSEWFEGSVVCYSNALKQSLLGVPEETLEKFGAVSEETVKAMVNGVLAGTSADVAVGVSGIAGPGGGSPEKPVGTIWLGWGFRDRQVHAQVYQFEGDREQIRRQSVKQALEMLLNTVSCD